MTTHSSILPWEIPWTEEPGGLQVHGVKKSWTLLSDLVCTHTHTLNRLLTKEDMQRADKYMKICSTSYVIVLSRFHHVRLFATPWTIEHQAPLSMGFPRQEYWSGLPLPSPGDLPDPGIEPMSLASPALAGGFFTTSPTWEAR